MNEAHLIENLYRISLDGKEIAQIPTDRLWLRDGNRGIVVRDYDGRDRLCRVVEIRKPELHGNRLLTDVFVKEDF